MGVRKLTDFFQTFQRFFAVSDYRLVRDGLDVYLNTNLRRYDVFLAIFVVNKELAQRTSDSLYASCYQIYKSYLPIAFYLFLKIDFLKRGSSFYYEACLLKKERYITFEAAGEIFYEKIDPVVFYFSPFLIALCSLLPNFKSDRIIIRRYRPLWIKGYVPTKL